MIDRPISVSELTERTDTPDALRRHLDVESAVRDLNEVGRLLYSQWATLNKNQIDANRLRVEIAKVKLAKALPDLKAMEHSAGDSADKVQFVINLDSATKQI